MARIWATTVTLEVDNESSMFSRIRDTRDAAHYLIDQWTRERTPAYRAAIRMCAKAMKGEASHEGAYISFMAAVREANLSLVSTRTQAERDELEADISQALAESILFEVRSEWRPA